MSSGQKHIYESTLDKKWFTAQLSLFVLSIILLTVSLRGIVCLNFLSFEKKNKKNDYEREQLREQHIPWKAQNTFLLYEPCQSFTVPSHVKTEGFEGKQKQNNHKQDCLQGCILLSWWLWSQRFLRTQSQDVQKRLTAVEDVGEAICTKDKTSAGGLHSVGCYRLCVSLGKCRLICMFLLLHSAVPCVFVWAEGPILTSLHGSFKFVITFQPKYW